MPKVYEHHHTVTAKEIDQLGHANNIAYVRWMQWAATAHSDAQGWTLKDYQALGAGWVVRSHKIEYRRPAFEGDRIVVRTWVAAMDKVTSLRKYEIRRTSDDELLAIAETDWVFVKYATGSPTKVRPQVAAAFEVFEG